jgi:hypothetical protein
MATNDFFDPDRLRDLGMGIARGFQTYDPNNPLASAGAAMEGTLTSQANREGRAQQRAEGVDDRERAAEDRERARKQANADQLDDEERAEQRRIDAEKRAETRVIATETRTDTRAEAQQAAELARFKGMTVGVVNAGKSTAAAEAARLYRDGFYAISGIKGSGGNSPIDPDEDVDAADARRPAVALPKSYSRAARKMRGGS